MLVLVLLLLRRTSCYSCCTSCLLRTRKEYDLPWAEPHSSQLSSSSSLMTASEAAAAALATKNQAISVPLYMAFLEAFILFIYSIFLLFCFLLFRLLFSWLFSVCDPCLFHMNYIVQFFFQFFCLHSVVAECSKCVQHWIVNLYISARGPCSELEPGM